ITVADIDGLLYLPHRSQQMLERAVRIPALSEGWRGSFADLLKQGEPVHNAWEGFRELTVTDVKRESSTITSFTLSAGSGQSTGPVPPGQPLTSRLRPGGPDQPAVIRSYSLSRVTDDTYRVSVKLEPHGAGSGFMHGHVHTGDVLDVAAPRGDFILRDTD